MQKEFQSKIILNVNGLNTPNQKTEMSDWVKKQDNYMLSIRNILQKQNINTLKVRAENIYQQNRLQRKECYQRFYKVIIFKWWVN